ncbi:unnamed protein product [Nezara viridula]|uniref:Uncharacterized protein n=1 Tax=Nezara viridula TaxID=85310 RepID=A0A9P0MQI9_NEZVI|nr:unnamed protein product [Nezara viridula]
MIVAALECQRLFSCVFSQGLMRFKDEIMEKIRNHHASKDIDRVLNSKSNPRYRKICSFNVTRPEDYLQFRALNLNKLRAVSRLRVAKPLPNGEYSSISRLSSRPGYSSSGMPSVLEDTSLPTILSSQVGEKVCRL